MLQGVSLPPAIQLAQVQLPQARTKPREAPIYSHVPHVYHMPENTAGQARPRQRQVAVTRVQHIKPAPTVISTITTPQHIQPAPILTSTIIPPPFIQPTQQIIPTPFGTILGQSQSTTLGKRSSGLIDKKQYKRKKAVNTCRKCGQFKIKDTGHTQYRGFSYCPKIESSTQEEWTDKKRQDRLMKGKQ